MRKKGNFIAFLMVASFLIGSLCKYEGSIVAANYKEPVGICLPDVIFDREIEPSGTCGEGLSYVLNEDGLLTITGTGKISNRSFEEVPAIKNVVIGEGVTAIGEDAFSNAWNIESVSFPDSLKSIESGAFAICRSLTTADIPEGVETIGESAFTCCFEMEEVNIPASVTIIEEDAFFGCISLEKIVVAEKNEAYDSRNQSNALIDSATNKLLAGCKNTVIPEGVITIGDSAFVSIEGLTEVVVPEGVKSIEESAFYYCVDLREIYIPESVEAIGSSVFEEYTGKLVIYAVKDSYAWKYAEENKIEVKEYPKAEEKPEDTKNDIKDSEKDDTTAESEKTNSNANTDNNATENTSNNTSTNLNNSTGSVSNNTNVTTISDKVQPVLKEQTLKVGKVKKYKAKKLKKKTVSFKLKVKSSGNGVITYKIKNRKSKYITVNKNGKVTLKKGIKKGVYKISVTAGKTDTYKKMTKVIVIEVC